MSVALPARAAGARTGTVASVRVVDALLFANVFTITFAKLRWTAGSVKPVITPISAITTSNSTNEKPVRCGR